MSVPARVSRIREVEDQRVIVVFCTALACIDGQHPAKQLVVEIGPGAICADPQLRVVRYGEAEIDLGDAQYHHSGPEIDPEDPARCVADGPQEAYPYNSNSPAQIQTKGAASKINASHEAKHARGTASRIFILRPISSAVG